MRSAIDQITSWSHRARPNFADTFQICPTARLIAARPRGKYTTNWFGAASIPKNDGELRVRMKPGLVNWSTTHFHDSWEPCVVETRTLWNSACLEMTSSSFTTPEPNQNITSCMLYNFCTKQTDVTWCCLTAALLSDKTCPPHLWRRREGRSNSMDCLTYTNTPGVRTACLHRSCHTTRW